MRVGRQVPEEISGQTREQARQWEPIEAVVSQRRPSLAEQQNEPSRP